MLKMRTRTLFALIGWVFAAASWGCSAPWGSPFARSEAPRMPATLHEEKTEYRAPPASEPDMAAVLDKLQQVREIDPSAEQRLLEELRQTPSKSWPLVAEQFRASLAYREQLAAKTPAVQQISSPVHQPQTEIAATPVTSPTGYGSADTETANRMVTPVAQRDSSSGELRPSAPIGTLVDPRNADADGISSEAFAKSTPYSTPGAVSQFVREAPSAPSQFVASDTVSPISAGGAAPNQDATATPSNEADPAVVPAHLEAVSGVAKAEGQTLPLDEGVDWQQLVERAAGDLNDRVAETPATTAEVHQHVSLRMLWLLAGKTEKALEPIPHVSPAEQDFWSRQLFALATYLDHHTQPDDKRRAAASVTHLDEATASLRELGALSLRNFTFCKNVYGYGSFETFPSDRFSPGEQIALYVEIENYQSKSTDKGYCTSLGSSYEVLDDHGERVAGGEFPDVEDCCRSRRRDFHIQYGLALPERIEPGRYRLQLVVKDRRSDKIGHATASFEIRGNRTDAALSPSPSR